MFLKHRDSGKLVEVLSLRDLFNPLHTALVGRYHAGEELQDPEQFEKSVLIFCSGETRAKTEISLTRAARSSSSSCAISAPVMTPPEAISSLSAIARAVPG